MTNELKAVRPPPRRVGIPPVDTSPLTSMPTEQLPDPPALFPEPPPASDLAPQQTSLILSVTILHRGRMITIASEGRSLDAFCDLLDKRFGVAS